MLDPTDSNFVEPDVLDAYLERLGISERPKPTLDTLVLLQERQVLTVPFENLDYHLGRPIPMGPAVVKKVSVDRRGGGCYELNPALHYVLLNLGFESRILPGRSYREGALSQPYMHLVLEVTAEGDDYLVDTGFRRNSRRPLLLHSMSEQPDPHGVYTLSPIGGQEYDLSLDGSPLYRFDRRGATVADFEPTLWWWRTCPESPFLQSIFCSLPTVDGRKTLTNRTLTITKGEGREKRELATDKELLDAYADHFDIHLQEVPQASSSGLGRAGIRFE